MKAHFLKLLVGCVTAAVLASAQPAAGIVYDFDRQSKPALESHVDNWDETTTVPSSWALQAWTGSYSTGGNPCINPDGLSGKGRCLTQQYGGTETHSARRPNDGGWSYDISSATKFALQSEALMDYPAGGSRGEGGFGIRYGPTGKWLEIGVAVPGGDFEYHPFVQMSYSSKMYYHTHGTFPLSPGDVLELRLEVDTQDNWNAGEGAYDGRGRFYVMKRGLHTAWQLLDNNINLQLAVQNHQIQNSNQLIVWCDTALIAQDSLQVAIPTGGPVTAKAFLDRNLDGNFDSDDIEGHDEILTGFDMRIAGPCACGNCGESPWDGTTDGSGEYTASQTRAGAAAGFDKLDDGTYKITDRELYFYVATDPCTAVVTAGGGALTKWYGVKPEMGDANLDGICDTQDFTILKAKLGTDPAYWADANFNYDTITDTQDFTILKDALGSMHPDYVPPGGAVPEPATGSVLALGALGLVLRRRRRS
ncbi:MAG: PEP-CTERM sorting domain-containing protein [Planctomycetota bacterium]|jgi:hypothetical protein